MLNISVALKIDIDTCNFLLHYANFFVTSSMGTWDCDKKSIVLLLGGNSNLGFSFMELSYLRFMIVLLLIVAFVICLFLLRHFFISKWQINKTRKLQWCRGEFFAKTSCFIHNIFFVLQNFGSLKKYLLFMRDLSLLILFYSFLAPKVR